MINLLFFIIFNYVYFMLYNIQNFYFYSPIWYFNVSYSYLIRYLSLSGFFLKQYFLLNYSIKLILLWRFFYFFLPIRNNLFENRKQLPLYLNIALPVYSIRTYYLFYNLIFIYFNCQPYYLYYYFIQRFNMWKYICIWYLNLFWID